MFVVTRKAGQGTGAAPFALHEKEILAAGGCRALLPVTVREEPDGTSLYFDTNGFVPFAAFPFKELGQMYRTVRSVVDGVQSVQNHLLDPGQIFADAEHIFLRGPEGEVAFVYGFVEKAPGAAAEAATQDPVRRVLRPLLTGFATFRHIEGFTEAVRDLAVRLGQGAPGYRGIYRQIAHSERLFTR
ncbi:MAG: DUF6382 domain-containing protein [Clostridiales Family XIII bacterium]|jgi:hypothetical protein|nr:DUF6382 domain-containing protein [Clostridiales Family XIII bacterium]